MHCLLCGAEMENEHCKVICPVCGYREDCSDAGLIIYPDAEEISESLSNSRSAEDGNEVVG